MTPTTETTAPAPLTQDAPPSSEQHSYGQILKSSVLIGGSQVISIAIRIVRTKIMAVLLGPAGIGLMGTYESIINLVQSIAGLGVNSSGVRQIAEAVGTGDADRIGRTAAVLRRTSVVLGIFGMILLLIFSKQVSRLTFGSEQHAAAVAFLSLAVCFGLISGGQGALIQGMRRISHLARMGVLGTLYGAIIGIPIVFFMREKGVAPALVAIAAMTVFTSWWYSRKVLIKPSVLGIRQIRNEASGLLRLGLAFMASAVLMMGAAYAVRTMVIRMVGFEAAGLYQSAWALGGLYVGFILQAMGADFYPRLTAVAKDNATCNRIVNEQTQISLLMAGPGVLATLTFAPFIISFFYTGKFNGAVPLLRWFCLGMILRVITWPMGYIVLAKGASKFFFLTELAWTVVNVGLSWLCITLFGLNGAGIAFLGSYVFHGFLIYPIASKLSSFHWSTANIRTGLIFLFLIGATFCSFYFLTGLRLFVFETLVLLFCSLYSARMLLKLVPGNRIPRPILCLLVRFHFLGSIK